MERPQYANAFSVTYNPGLGEVVINFAIEYPIVSPSATTAPGAVQVETKTAREIVSSFALPSNIAMQLCDVIHNLMSSNQSNG